MSPIVPGEGDKGSRRDRKPVCGGEIHRVIPFTNVERSAIDTERFSQNFRDEDVGVGKISTAVGVGRQIIGHEVAATAM